MASAPSAGAALRFPTRLTLWGPHPRRNRAKVLYSVYRRRIKDAGQVDFVAQTIKVQPAGVRETVATLAHESFHVAAPDLHEDVIERLELNALAVLDAALPGWDR